MGARRAGGAEEPCVRRSRREEAIGSTLGAHPHRGRRSGVVHVTAHDPLTAHPQPHTTLAAPAAAAALVGDEGGGGGGGSGGDGSGLELGLDHLTVQPDSGEGRVGAACERVEQWHRGVAAAAVAGGAERERGEEAARRARRVKQGGAIASATGRDAEAPGSFHADSIEAWGFLRRYHAPQADRTHTRSAAPGAAAGPPPCTLRASSTCSLHSTKRGARSHSRVGHASAPPPPPPPPPTPSSAAPAAAGSNWPSSDTSGGLTSDGAPRGISEKRSAAPSAPTSAKDARRKLRPPSASPPPAASQVLTAAPAPAAAARGGGRSAVA
eukprot:scaffold24531_cov59-Phaeocystis_antarctica.AAC.3